MSHLSEDRFDELVAKEREREHPPLNSWAQIAELAREEGLIRGGTRSLWSAGRPWMQAAAGIVILLGGVAIGRTTGDHDASITRSAPATASISSVDEAWQRLNQASEEYQSAAAFLAAQNARGPAVDDSAGIFKARLAALEELMKVTATARENAPQDPVLSQYYLSALGAREATAHQLGTVRPANLTRIGF